VLPNLIKFWVTIEERSPQGARHVQARIQAIINLLLQYPYAGQPTSKGRLRRVVAFPYPYLIFLAWLTEEYEKIGIPTHLVDDNGSPHHRCLSSVNWELTF